MNAKITILEIKNNDAIEQWGQRLSTEFLDEAKISLGEENVIRETVLTFTVGEKKYLVGVMLSDGEILPANPDRMLNKKHREVLKDNFVARVESTVSYNIAV